MTNTLYIPFHKFRYLGGPSSFMRNLKGYLDSIGYKYSKTFWNSNGIFFPMGYRPSKLKLMKMMGMKVIQRLDGVYYPSKHGASYEKTNKFQEITYNKYADFVIFQSEYCKAQVFEMFGEIPEEKFALIYNGVNKDIFYPLEAGKKISKKIKFVTTGNFRNADMIEPVVLALDSVSDIMDFELHIVGPVTNQSLNKFFTRKYIVNHGSKNLQEVAEILRNCDIFLYSHLNPPCPNSVLEAISTGLPIVGFDSGSMSELCYFSKDLLAYVSDEIFQKYDDFDCIKLAEKIEIVVEKYDYYKEIAMRNSILYDFNECGNKYVNVFKEVLS